MSDGELPDLPPDLLEELALLASGKPVPSRPWSQRSWRPGEPAWTLFQGPGGDFHLFPVRVLDFNPSIQHENALLGQEGTIPQISWKGDLRWPAVQLPDAYLLRAVLPREVSGEEW